MSRDDIILSWKDAQYFDALSESERAALPDHPSGAVAVPDELLGAAGGEGPFPSMADLTIKLTSLPCTATVVQVLSCFKCDDTIWQGTCGVLSVGCCVHVQ